MAFADIPNEACVIAFGATVGGGLPEHASQAFRNVCSRSRGIIAMDTSAAFISYVRQNSDVVDGLAADLRARGITVWLDRDDIMPGQFWKDAIRDAIQNGAYFIACFSKELHERQEAYMHGELRLAIDRLRNMPRNRVWFIPVLINESDIPDHRISDHETLRDINAIKLFEGRQEGLQKILRAMKFDDPDHRRALHLIAMIRHHPAERAYAIQHLNLWCKHAAVAEAVPALSKALRDAHSVVRRYAAEALGEIGPPAAEAVPALSEAFRDASRSERLSVAEALGKIGPPAAEAVPALSKALRDADMDLRLSAAEALGKIGPPAAEAVPALSKALRSTDWVMRRYAAEALGKIGPPAAEAIPALSEALHGTDRDVSRAAAEALKRIKPAEG